MAGRGGGGGAAAHGSGDRLHHALDIPQHIVVPEAQHAIAARLEIGGSLGIAHEACGFIMLAAVHFNDQAHGMTGEISEVGSDGCLTTEVRATDS